MSEHSHPDESLNPPSREEMNAALFAHLVMQQSNMAMLLLGKVPHPETGKTTQDLETARLFIDMFEMLEAKTKGNLSKEEAGLLKQTLMSLRMAYVEAVNSGSGTPAPPNPEPSTPPTQAAPTSGEESHKRFSKKY